MKERVTVVAEDKLIIVNGDGLEFDFEHPKNLHAIQWHDGAGHIEYKDSANKPIESYEKEVQPYVALWEAEKARLEAEQAAAEAAALAEYNSEEARFARLREERDARLAATDYYIMPDYPASEESKAAVMAYRQALRDLPSLEGAPWDGGGEETPWPVNPLDA